MKTFIWIVCLITALSGTACTEVYFEEAQPEGRKAKKAIPKDFRGMYVSSEEEGEPGDTSLVGNNYYQQIEYHKKSILLTQIDSMPEYSLENGQFTVYDSKKKPQSYQYKVSDGTVFYWEREEVFLGLSDTVVYKTYKGKHFLNIREDDGWVVMLMNKDDAGDLVLRTVTKDDIERIQKITKAKPIIKPNGRKVDYYLLDPSCKELIQMVDAGLFHNDSMIFEEKFRVQD